MAATTRQLTLEALYRHFGDPASDSDGSSSSGGDSSGGGSDGSRGSGDSSGSRGSDAGSGGGGISADIEVLLADEGGEDTAPVDLDAADMYCFTCSVAAPEG